MFGKKMDLNDVSDTSGLSLQNFDTPQRLNSTLSLDSASGSASRDTLESGIYSDSFNFHGSQDPSSCPNQETSSLDNSFNSSDLKNLLRDIEALDVGISFDRFNLRDIVDPPILITPQAWNSLSGASNSSNSLSSIKDGGSLFASNTSSDASNFSTGNRNSSQEPTYFFTNARSYQDGTLSQGSVRYGGSAEFGMGTSYNTQFNTDTQIPGGNFKSDGTLAAQASINADAEGEAGLSVSSDSLSAYAKGDLSATASAATNANLNTETQFLGADLKTNGALTAQASIGARAEGGVGLLLSPNEIDAHAQGGLSAAAQASANANLSTDLNVPALGFSAGTNAQGQGDAFAGAQLNGQAGIALGPDKANISLGGGAFAGASASVEGGGSLSIDGEQLANVHGGVGVKAGVGASGKLDAGYQDGTLNLDFGAGLALGLGAELNGGLSVKVPKVLGDGVVTAVKAANDIVTTAANTVSDLTSGATNAASDLTAGVENAASDLISGDVGGAASSLASGTVNAVGDLASSVAHAGYDITSGTVNTVGDIVSGTVKTVSAIVSGTEDIVSDAGSAVGDVISDGVSVVGDAVSDGVSVVGDAVSDGVSVVGDAVSNGVSAATDGVKEVLSFFGV